MVTEEQLLKFYEEIGALSRTAKEVLPEAAVVLLTLQAALADGPHVTYALANLCAKFSEKLIEEKRRHA